MEQMLDKVLTDVASQTDTVGCLLANKQGLCIGTKGNINPIMSGVGVALAEQANKLNPKQGPPVITLYSGNKRCIIQSKGDLTGVIYKQTDYSIPTKL